MYVQRRRGLSVDSLGEDLVCLHMWVVLSPWAHMRGHAVWMCLLNTLGQSRGNPGWGSFQSGCPWRRSRSMTSLWRGGRGTLRTKLAVRCGGGSFFFQYWIFKHKRLTTVFFKWSVWLSLYLHISHAQASIESRSASHQCSNFARCPQSTLKDTCVRQ